MCWRCGSGLEGREVDDGEKAHEYSALGIGIALH